MLLDLVYLPYLRSNIPFFFFFMNSKFDEKNLLQATRTRKAWKSIKLGKLDIDILDRTTVSTQSLKWGPDILQHSWEATNSGTKKEYY